MKKYLIFIFIALCQLLVAENLVIIDGNGKERILEFEQDTSIIKINGIEIITMQGLENFPNLKVIDIVHSNFYKTDFSFLENSPTLETFNVSFASFLDYSFLVKAEKLKYICLVEVSIKKNNLFQYIGECLNLETFICDEIVVDVFPNDLEIPITLKNFISYNVEFNELIKENCTSEFLNLNTKYYFTSDINFYFKLNGSVNNILESIEVRKLRQLPFKK
ncbi:hypothetical protein [Treponema brennaborense]|uniref:Uncharacterized protein n=1 Tax=Treponema brennaborense (strain DSM 12168 / CIP 105900 / DD5/3) TaxID=906968 RepID=F4LML1_TREBD|nr:hypothetical protein [Treponema brennaborense]AEE16758.1 hypothetical protein Trebr_1333 [Treponema brennaborense DSM 12168]